MSGIELDDRQSDNNESTRAGPLLEPGRPRTLVYTVRAKSVTVEIDGATVIDWTGDPKRLSMPDIFKLPEPGRLAIASHLSVFRLSKIDLEPLAPELPGGQVASSTSEKATTGLLKIFEDEPDFVDALKSADAGAEAVLASNEVYSGKASVKVTPSQRFSEALPGLNVKVRKQPVAPGEYRYLRFAWKKRGGEQIWLQLHYPNNWFRYRAGPNRDGVWSGVRVADELPTEFVVVTRDLAADFGEFTFDGLALTPFDGKCAWFDHIYLARTLEDFERVEAKVAKSEPAPNNPPARKFADLVSGKQSRVEVPDDEKVKKARQELQKKIAADLSSAKTAEQKRKLAQRLIDEAGKSEKNAAAVYSLLRQATDLAEAAGDLDLAWQATEQLAQSFTVDALALRQQSLTEVGKVAKSPEQARELASAASRLMAMALAEGKPGAIKKVAAQAQGFAKRAKDTALVKEMAARTRDAGKLATEFESVAAARETLKTAPDDAQANFTLGHYELCAAGDWTEALPKLAKGSDADWQKLAKEELILTRGLTMPDEQTASADAWWSRAEKGPWPGKHYLRMRAAERYRRALPTLDGERRSLAMERLKTLLATDDGLPSWELFDMASRGTQNLGSYVRLARGGALRTPVDYDGALDITFVARTDGLNIRLFSHSHESVIWNWEMNTSELRVTRPDGRMVSSPTTPLEPNRWYTFRYLVTPQSTTIFVDGQSVFGENQFYKLSRPSPVGVNGAMGSVIDVKKFVVKPL